MGAAPELACIGLGANLGDARAALQQAFDELARLPHTCVRRRSSLYSSAPVEATGPDYLNAVVQLQTSLEPEALLVHLQRIERALGRERPFRNAPRTLDLDLLLYGERQMSTPDLIIPHPRMHQRAFVLAPLAEVAGESFVVPGHGTVRSLLAQVADQPISLLERQS